jgi:uncharacterized protein YbaP (TraB family)
MKKFLPLTFLIISALILSNFAVSAQVRGRVKGQVKKPAKPAVKPADESTGLLYEISGKGLRKPSYVFGTIHIICQKDMFSMDTLTGYIDKTQQLMMELDMDDPTVMQSMSSDIFIPGGKSITDYLTAEESAKVDEMIKSSLGVPLDRVKTIKPVMLEAMLMASPKALGCSPPSSYELSFVQIAGKEKKPISGLETAKFQSDLLSKAPLDKQAKGLYKLAQDPQKAFDQFNDMLAAYKLQDMVKLKEQIDKQMAEEKDFAGDMLDNRNKVWIPKIERAIKLKPTFIAVGGGHLVGDNGVVNLLRKRGYTVKAIKL